MVTILTIAYAVLAAVVLLACLIWNIVPFTALASTALVIGLVPMFGAKVPPWALAGGSLIVWLALISATHQISLTHTKPFVCKDCGPDKKAVNGQELVITLDGATKRFVNQGFAGAKEQANINHAEILAYLAERSGQTVEGRFEVVYLQGRPLAPRLVGVDGRAFQNFYYMPDR